MRTTIAKTAPALVHDQKALDATRMSQAHDSIIKANIAFGTAVIFRAGSSYDASRATAVVRKSLKDKDKTASFGPAIGGIPKLKIFGKRKPDKESCGELYKYVGNSDGDCYTQQSLPLSFVLQEFVKGTYQLVNPITGVSASYQRKEDQNEFEHKKVLRECLDYIRKNKKLCVKLNRVPTEYQPLKDLGHIYRYDLSHGEKSLDPESLLSAASTATKQFLENYLPEFKSQFTDHFLADFAHSATDAALGKFEKIEIYAKKIKMGADYVNVRKSSDEDRLANTIDYASENGRALLDLIPDADELIDTTDAETGNFGREFLAQEILKLDEYIENLQDAGTHPDLLLALETIYNAFAFGTGEQLASLYGIIATVGCTTKREFFWQLYTNILIHKDAAHYFHLVQHGNETYNPGIPSDIDKAILQDKSTGKAILANSEELLVDCLLSDAYKKHGMYLNPRWIHDDHQEKTEHKETISAYKAKGHLWGALLYQQITMGLVVEVEVLISFYKYLLKLKKKDDQINQFLSLHAHDHLPSFESIKQKHRILQNCRTPKEASELIEKLMKTVPDEIMKRFYQNMGNAILRLEDAATSRNLTKIVLLFSMIQRKLTHIKALINQSNLSVFKKQLLIYLKQIEINLLKFNNNPKVVQLLMKPLDIKAAEYIKKQLPLIRLECIKLQELIKIAEDAEDDGKKIDINKELERIELDTKSDDSDGEGRKVKFKFYGAHKV